MREAIIKACRAMKATATYAAFWQTHQHCECCGNWSAAPHHIRSRGAGGDDSPLNLLALCMAHHTEAHQFGTVEFALRYPRVASKIEAALEREK